MMVEYIVMFNNVSPYLSLSMLPMKVPSCVIELDGHGSGPCGISHQHKLGLTRTLLATDLKTAQTSLVSAYITCPSPSSSSSPRPSPSQRSSHPSLLNPCNLKVPA